MISTVNQNQNNSSSKICCQPIRWICEKIGNIFRAIFGYLLRIILFQLGEIKVPGAYTIMRAYQRLSSDPREKKPFDLHRLTQAKKFLIHCGGEEVALRPADGQAEVRCMTFKSERFFHHFNDLGVERTEILLRDPVTGEENPRFALIPKQEMLDAAYKPMRDHFTDEMHKFRFPVIDIQTADGIVKGGLLPESPQFPPGQRPIWVHFHSPGRSMAMELRLLGLLLGAGYDVAMSDLRGTAESVGKICEGGGYLDAEAVYNHVHLQKGYPHNRIYISGFCEGAAWAAHLKKLYHPHGAHFIGANPFDSADHLVSSHGWFAKFVSPYAIPALKSEDPSISNLVEQDGMDTVSKFTGLPPSTGKFIFIRTDTDKTVPEDSVARIVAAIANAGPVKEILREHPNKKIDGHTQPPYEDPRVWSQLIEVDT